MPKAPKSTISTSATSSPFSATSDRGSTNSHSTTSTDQNNHLKRLRHELVHRECPGFEEEFCAIVRPDDSRVTNIAEAIRNQYSQVIPQLHGQPEKQLYNPFIKTLNAFEEARAITQSTNNILYGLRMFTNLNTLNSLSGFDSPLIKPDGIGLVTKVDLPNIRADWRDVQLLYETKRGYSNKMEGIIRCASYARAVMYHQCNRWRIFAFIQTGRATRALTAYDRAECIYTPDINLDSPDGRERLARIILAFLSRSDEDIGFDHSVSVDGSRVRWDGKLYRTRLISRPQVMTGQAPYIYRILSKDEPGDLMRDITPFSIPETSNSEKRPNMSEKSARSSTQSTYDPPRDLNDMFSPQDSSPQLSSDQEPSAQLPSTQQSEEIEIVNIRAELPLHPNLVGEFDFEFAGWVLKISWVFVLEGMTFENADREGKAIDSINGSRRVGKELRGLPLFGSRIGTGLDGSRLCTSKHNPCAQRVREQVGHLMSYGVHLGNTKGPKELCQIVEDCIRGLRNLFTLGYIHRDISIGNVYMIPQENHPLSREKSESASTEDSRPRGMVADYDRTIEYTTEVHDGVRRRRCGTNSFMSMYVLEFEDPKHSPIHDLESLLWVLLWVIGHKAMDASHKQKDAEERIRSRFLDSMNSDLSMITAASRKRHVFESLPGGFSSNNYLPWLEPFKNLLLHLRVVVLKYNVLSMGGHDNPGVIFSEKHIKAAFSEYLHAFETHRPIEETWNYLESIK